MTTEPLPVLPDEPSTRRRRRRWPWVLAVTFVLLAVVVVVGDGVARGVAERRFAEEASASLPPGSEPIAVSIGGFSFLQQLAVGSFERVEIDAPAIVTPDAQGAVTVSGSVVAEGVPLDGEAPVQRATGELVLTEQAVQGLVQANVDGIDGAAVTLGDDVVRLTGGISIFGFDVDVRVTLRPELDGDTIVFAAEGAEITGGGAAGIDLERLVPQITAARIPVCVAQVLPEGVELTSVDVTGDGAVIGLAADDLVLTADALSRTGSCGA